MKIINSTLIWFISILPKKIVWLFAKSYIAGEDIKAVVSTTNNLREKGILVTIDVLGEYITDISQAIDTKDEYLNLIQRVNDETKGGNVSVKPTAFGLLLDGEKCYELIREVVIKAKEKKLFVRIDMEDSECTEKEIQIYFRLLEEFPKNIGLVIQAYLYRSYEDLQRMVKKFPEPYSIDIRLCKGIYVEPANIAFRKKNINPNYIKLLDFMLKNKIYTCIATHDKKLVEESFKLIEKYEIPKDRYEFQMLYGVTPNLRNYILNKGHKMRVYIPYGKDWHGYSIRRLKESPNVAMNIFKSLFFKG